MRSGSAFVDFMFWASDYGIATCMHEIKQGVGWWVHMASSRPFLFIQAS